MEWKLVGLWMGWKLAQRRMQFAVRSGPEVRSTVAGNTLTAVGNIQIDSDNTQIALRGLLANSGYSERGTKREQQKTKRPKGIPVNESRPYPEHGDSNYTRTKKPTASISPARLKNRASSLVFAIFP